MVFYVGVCLVIVVGGLVIAGLVAVVRADLKHHSSQVTANVDEPAQEVDLLQDAMTQLWDSNLLLALLRSERGTPKLPPDSMVHLLARDLARDAAHWVAVDEARHLTLNPARIREVVAAPTEDLLLGVRSYNFAKRLGIDDLGQLLGTSASAMTGDAGLAPKDFDELRNALATYFTKTSLFTRRVDPMESISLPGEVVTASSRTEIFRDSHGHYRIRLMIAGADPVDLATTYDTEDEARKALLSLRSDFAFGA